MAFAQKNAEQDQLAVHSAVAAPGAAAAVAAAAAADADAAAAEASSSNSNSNSSSSRKAEAAEDAESTSKHLRMYSVYSSARFFGLILKTKKLYLVPSSSDLRHRDYPTHAQQSYPYQVPQLRHLPQALPVPPSVERA